MQKKKPSRKAPVRKAAKNEPKLKTAYRCSLVESKEKLKQKLNKETKAQVLEIVKQMELDPDVEAIRKRLRALIESARVTIQYIGTDPRASYLAQNLNQIWEQHIGDMFDCFRYGRVAFEKVFADFNVNANLKLLKQLRPLAYDDTDMILDSDNHFGGIKFKGVENQEIELEPYCSWWLAIDTDAKNPFGKSAYLGAPYEMYLSRSVNNSRLDLFDQRLSIGQTIMKAPSKLPNSVTGKGTMGEIGNDGMPVDPIEDTAKQLSGLQAGGSMVIPSECYEDGKAMYEYVKTAEPISNSPLSDRDKQLSRALVKAFGINPDALEGSGNSTYGSMREAAVALEQIANQLLRQIIRSFKRYVINPLIEMNEFESKPQLSIEMQPLIGATPTEMLAATMTLLTNGAAVASYGLLDMKDLILKVGLTPAKDIDRQIDKIKMMPAPATLSLSLEDKKKRVYDWEDIAAAATDECKVLFEQLQEILLDPEYDPAAIDSILKQITDVRTQGILAAKLWGYLKPFAEKKKNLAFENLGFPLVESAVDYILKENILYPAQIDDLLSDSAIEASNAAGSFDSWFKQILADSVSEGLNRKSWRKKIKDLVSLSDYQAEAIQRTYSHRANINATHNAIITDPSLTLAFSFAQYVATLDTRTRQTHRDYNDKIMRVGSVEYNHGMELLNDYNCRCTMIYLNESDARELGYSE